MAATEPTSSSYHSTISLWLDVIVASNSSLRNFLFSKVIEFQLHGYQYEAANWLILLTTLFYGLVTFTLVGPLRFLNAYCAGKVARI